MRISRRELLAGGVAVSAGLLGACGDSSTSHRTTPATKPGSDLGAVEHIVFIMQENRSFDHYFGTYPGVRGFGDRSGGALRAFNQPWPGGPAAKLLPFNLASATAQICAGNADIPNHDWAPQHLSWNGGANDQFVTAHEALDGAAQAPLVMGHYTRAQLGYYYALADAFTICDAYHCSVIGPTMPNRLYSLSATIDPSGAHGGPVLQTPGFADAKDAVGSVDWPTMPEALLDHGVSWKVYQPPNTSVGPGIDLALAAGFNALLFFKQYLADPNSALYRQAFLPSWPDEFTADVAKGTLPQVSWMIPPLAYSEHPNSSPAAGEHYVSQVLSTLMANAALWSKTVVVLSFDENGGFFDHVPPPTPPANTPGEWIVNPPADRGGGGVNGPIGLGFRVPAIVISPWSRGGYLDSTTYDHTSQLRLLETRFGVPVPNLTPWRRSAVADLTTALGFGSSNDLTPSLPATSYTVDSSCPSPTNIAPALAPPEAVTVPSRQQLPTQEPGSPRRR